MQDSLSTPPSGDKGLGLIWRLAQIVLVLAAAYLYFFAGSFAGLLQRDRLFSNPHTWPLIQAVFVGLGIGVCLGLAVKDLSKGEIVLHLDWPTLLINLIAAGVFVAVAVSLDVAAVRNTAIIQGPIKDAVIASPLVPFVWVGLALASIVRKK